MTKKEQAELSEAQRTCIVIKNSRKNQSLVNTFWRWCRANKKPYIEIVIHGKLANVSYDMPNASGSLDSTGQKKLQQLCTEFGYPDQRGNRLNGADDLPKEQAMPFAKQLADICFERSRLHNTDEERDDLET